MSFILFVIFIAYVLIYLACIVRLAHLRKKCADVNWQYPLTLILFINIQARFEEGKSRELSGNLWTLGTLWRCLCSFVMLQKINDMQNLAKDIFTSFLVENRRFFFFFLIFILHHLFQCLLLAFTFLLRYLFIYFLRVDYILTFQKKVPSHYPVSFMPRCGNKINNSPSFHYLLMSL